MVFDPLSVIGCVGTAAGLISFLANTVARLSVLRADFKDCEKKLRWCRSRFATSLVILRAWRRRCCGINVEDDDYEYLWGVDGFNEIKEKMALIKEEIDDIGSLLYTGMKEESRLGQALTTLEWQQLQERHMELMQLGETFNPGRNWFQKLCFTLYEGIDLEERSKRLKEKIEDLEVYSRTVYWLSQNQADTTTAVTEVEIQQLLERKQRLDELSKLLTDLYKECERQQDCWSLILSPPDADEDFKCIDKQTELRIEFDTFRMNRMDSQLYEKGILELKCSDLESRSISELLAEKYQNSLRIPFDRSKPLKEILLSDNHELARVLRVGLDSRIARTTTALGLVNWTVLLWHTPWTLGICTCRIRYVFLDQNGSICCASFTAMPNTIIRRPCHIRDANLKGRRALLLGVSLAEIALARPIHVDVGPEGQPLLQMTDQTISERELLKLVKVQSCLDFMRAVQFCLSYDAKMVSEGFTFRPRDMLLFKENVLDV